MILPFASANPKLWPWRTKMQELKIGESLTIPWSDFSSDKPRTGKERAISDGKKSWVIMPVNAGVFVKRIE